MNLQTILKYAIGPVGVSLLSFAVVPILAWSYDERSIANYAIIQALIAFSTLIFTLGVDQAFVREYYDSNNKAQLLKNTIIAVFIPMTLVLLLLTIFFYKEIGYYLFDESSQTLIFLLSLSLILVVVNRILSLIQRMENQALLYSLSQILPKFIFLFIIAIPIIGYIPPAFKTLIIAQFVSLLLVNLYFLIVNKVVFFESYREKIKIDKIKELLSYGLPLLLSNFLFWGLRYLDRFYMKLLSNDFELALYTIAITVAGSVAIFSSIFNTIWTPRAFFLFKSGGLNINIINKLVVIISFIGFFIVVGLFLLSPLVSLFFPQKYNSITYLLPLLILPTLYYTVAEVSGIGISIAKKTTKMIYVSLFSFILHFVLSLFFIFKFGALGAAIAIAIAFYFYLLLKTFYAEKVWVKGVSKLALSINFICLVCSILIGIQWL